MPETLSANHIAAAGAGGKFEPQRNNHWILEIPGLPGKGSEVLKLSVKDHTLPAGTNEPITIPFGNEDRKVAGRYTIEALTISFHDYVEEDVLGTLFQWRKLVYDRSTGTVGRASAYKKTGFLTLVGPDGNTLRRYHLQGVWPQNDPPAGLDQGGNEALLVSMTFAIDRFKPHKE